MRADYDDPNYEAQPVDMTPRGRWKEALSFALIVAAIVIMFSPDSWWLAL